MRIGPKMWIFYYWPIFESVSFLFPQTLNFIQFMLRLLHFLLLFPFLWPGYTVCKLFVCKVQFQLPIPIPLLGISIDGCRIWTFARRSRQKIVREVAALKNDGCIHPLPKTEGCSCTRRTRSNKDHTTEPSHKI